MEFLLLLLVSVVSLGQCSVNNTICVKSKTATLKEGASIVLCTQICSSINECNFSSPLSTVIVLRSGDHELSTSIELQERSITKLLGSSLSTRIKCAPNTGL